MGAVGRTTDETVKLRFEEEFKARPDIAALARKQPAAMTTAKAVASARRVQGGELESGEPYKTVSVWHTFMRSNWDFVR